MYKLMIITASTRDGRKGPALTRWIEAEARKDSDWEIVPADLKEIALPMMEEPEHPRFKKYKYEHTKQWSALVDGADAFITVLPEYNFAIPPALLNALDYLSQEWAYKPMGFVSYGGVSAGTRSLNMTRQIVSALKIVPITEAVNVPFFTQFINAEGVFAPNEQGQQGANMMFAELKKWAGPLKAMRNQG